MRLFKARDEKTYDKARKRLSGRDKPTVAIWANSALWSTQEGLEHWQDPAALEQARTGVVTLLAAIDHLLDKPL